MGASAGVLPQEHQQHFGSLLQAYHAELTSRGLDDQEIQIALKKRYDDLVGGSTGGALVSDHFTAKKPILTYTIQFCEN